MTNASKQYMYYWLQFLVGYVLPIIYYIVKLGITEKRTSLVFAVLILISVAVFKLMMDLPRLVSTWSPSFKKGLVKALPKLFLFILFLTLGLIIKPMATRLLEASFVIYFEAVFVVFGSLAVSSIFEAYHLMYKELHLIEKGYVLGVVNK